MGLPFSFAPFPFWALYILPNAGLCTTPTTISPSMYSKFLEDLLIFRWKTAMETAWKGRFRMKLLVPSMGSIIQMYSASLRSALSPVSSPRMAWSGKFFLISLIIRSSTLRSVSVTKSLADFSSIFMVFRPAFSIILPAFLAVAIVNSRSVMP